jgi:quercetin dioxygenase-like cupin family protein
MSETGAIKIYYADHAEELDAAMDHSNIHSDDLPFLSRLAEAGLDDGTVTRVLFSDEQSGVSLTYAWFKKNFPLPRHRHNADCLYYVISGDLRLGTKILSAGDGFMVPADTVYSYVPGENGVEVLEFRTAASFDIRFRSSETAWEKLISMAISNRDGWQKQEDPPVAKRIKGMGE